MKSLSDCFAPGQRRGAEALARLQAAYERVFFTPDATTEDQQIVLVDLATYCGNFFVEPTESINEQLRETNGRRLVMGRIIRLGLGKTGDSLPEPGRADGL